MQPLAHCRARYWKGLLHAAAGQLNKTETSVFWKCPVWRGHCKRVLLSLGF